MIVSLFSFRRAYEIVGMQAADAAAVHRLHAEHFARPWSDGEFVSLLSQVTVFGHVVRLVGAGEDDIAGFVLARAAGGEAEILSLAVSGAHTRLGLGWRLMNSALREAHGRGALAMFLEVDEANRAAIALYHRLGFVVTGRRKDYYHVAEGKRSSALVMRCDLI